MAKNTEIVVRATDKELAALRNEFPTEATFNRVLLPRFGLVSQDKTEGKGKAMKVIAEAGTLFLERQGTEIDEATGKKEWEREELGTEAEGIILFQRRQLRMYDEDTEKYTSSPIYDSDEEIVPLFCDKKEVDRGMPKELKAKYEYKGKDGKTKSALEDNKILYVLIGEEIFQLNLRGSSMYSFLTYARSVTPNTVLTRFSSEAREKGDIAWNMMTFESARGVTSKEAGVIMHHITDLKNGILAEKAFYAGKAPESAKRDDESDEEYHARLQHEKDF